MWRWEMMRILFDESLPSGIAALLIGHESTSVQQAGWSGVKNGKLLALAAAQFDVFLTVDQNIEFLQNLAALPIAVVILVVRRTRIQAIAPLIPALLELLQNLPVRALQKIGV